MNPRTAAALATLGATLAAGVVGLAVVFDLQALRMILAIALCLLLPGLGWARRFRLSDRGDTLALAIVLSICSTVAVATAMAVSGWWSTVAGFVSLLAISVGGFVPTAGALARLGAVFPPPADGSGEWVDWYRERQQVGIAAQQQAESEWVDWYAGARRLAAEGRAREAALRREAEEQWAEWYRTTHPDRMPAWRR